MLAVAESIQKRVAAKVAECWAIARAKYSTTKPLPTITFALRGTTGGTANYKTWTVDFNSVILNENVEEFIATVVPHECAHLITDEVYPRAHRPPPFQKRRPHGAEWQSVMRALGVSPDRCHKFDTKNARVKTKKRYEYKCSCCGASIMVTKKKHEHIQMFPAAFSHAKCPKKPLVFLGVKPDLTQAAPNTKTPAAPKAGTKLDQCLMIYQTHPNRSRDIMIDLFMRNVGMSKPFATTYYYQCRKLTETGV